HEFPHRSLLLLHPRPPRSTLFPYTTLFRSPRWDVEASPSLVYGARLLSGFGAQNPIEGSNPSASAASLRQQDRTLVPNGHAGSVVPGAWSCGSARRLVVRPTFRPALVGLLVRLLHLVRAGLADPVVQGVDDIFDVAARWHRPLGG